MRIRRSLCWLGGAAAVALVVYALATIVQVVMLGGAPASAAEMFELLNRNRVVGLLRLDAPTVIVMPLYCILFLGLLAALRGTAMTLFATVLAFAGVALFLSVPTPFSMVPLADQYATATNAAERVALLHAGEAYLASDLWHGMRSIVGGIMVEVATFLMCVAMLRGAVFHRFVAWLGLGVHGLDALHLVAMPFVPGAGAILMMIAGPFHPVWLVLVAYKLLQLGRRRVSRAHPTASSPR